MENVKISCVNTNTTYQIPLGSTLLEASQKILGADVLKPMAVLVDNSLQDLSYRVFIDRQVEFVDASTQDGYSVNVRSLIFLLYTAFRELYPKGSMVTEFYISNGVYCTLNAKDFSANEECVAKIKKRMLELVKADWQIIREPLKTEQAIALFRKNGLSDKADLLAARGRLRTSVYKINDTVDYFFGVLAPSTGLLNVFDLQCYEKGVLLLLPSKQNPEVLPEVKEQPKLLKVFEENREFGKILTVSNIGDLNRLITNGHGSSVIKICEAFQEKKISAIADMIAARKQDVKVVLIAGPSSSGKTTFCKRLSVQMMVNGIEPVALSMDNYFVEREKTPRDENGNYDFETIDAVDIPFFVSNVKSLLAGEEIDVPKFSFVDGHRFFDGTKLKLGKRSMLVIEGIHGLNPKLTSLLEEKTIFKIFISALTAISIDEHNPISPTDNRLIRRMVRDFNYRGRSAQMTMAGCDSVMEGERKHIIPYQEQADVMFNTAMMYELGVLRAQAEPLLREVPESSPEHSKALKLLKFLSFVKLVQADEIPQVSLLREFLGGSSFHYD